MKIAFNIKDTILEEAYCGYQEYIFDCTPCSQKHLQEMIKYGNFRKKSENTYLSEYSLSTEMTVLHKTGNKDCLTLVFKNIKLPKKEYKEKYEMLNTK